MSFAALVESVRKFRNDGRVAETTIRAAPDFSSGTLSLPTGRVIVIRSGAAGDVTAIFACSAASSEKRGIDLPFCSSATVSALNLAFGASAVTTSVPAWPIALSGCSMRTIGTVSLRAKTNTTPAAINSRRNSPAGIRIMRTNLNRGSSLTMLNTPMGSVDRPISASVELETMRPSPASATVSFNGLGRMVLVSTIKFGPRRIPRPPLSTARNSPARNRIMRTIEPQRRSR